jgi:biotin transport system substrate-specific component
MTALAHSLVGRRSRTRSRAPDIVTILVGSLVVAGLAQIAVRLPFTPVPVTGQTLGVLLVGASLGSLRGTASMLVYLAVGAAGVPLFAQGQSGIGVLAASSPTAGYLWGFVLAALVVGWLAERGWDRGLGSSLGAMLVGEVVIFACGVTWLGAALGVAGERALELGLYPFVLGDLLKLVIAAAALPAAWRLIAR